MHSQNTIEDEQLVPEQQISSFMDKINQGTNFNNATVSSLDSSGSSLTEQIFANALSNLENSSCSEDDDVQFKEDEYENNYQNVSGNNSFLGQCFNLKEIMKEHSVSSNNNSLSYAANYVYQTPSKNFTSYTSGGTATNNQYAMLSEASCPSTSNDLVVEQHLQMTPPTHANQADYLMMVNNHANVSACYQTPIKQLSC